MNTVLMLAGGVGTRMGANIPKQFIKIKGKPIIAYTLDIMEKNVNIDAVEIVCVHGFEDLIESIIEEYGFKKVKWICEGGPTFLGINRSQLYRAKNGYSAVGAGLLEGFMTAYPDLDVREYFRCSGRIRRSYTDE